MIKTTLVTLSTTPTLLVGATTAAVIDVSKANPDDPVTIVVESFSGGFYLQGSSAAIGATPTLFSVTGTVDQKSRWTATFYAASDSIFVASTAAGTLCDILGTRQNAS